MCCGTQPAVTMLNAFPVHTDTHTVSHTHSHIPRAPTLHTPTPDLSVFWSDPDLGNVSWTHADSIGDFNDLRTALVGYRPQAMVADDDTGTMILLEATQLLQVSLAFPFTEEVLHTGMVEAKDVAFDPRARVVYWTERELVQRADIDTRPFTPQLLHSFASVQPATGVFRPEYIAVDWLRGVLYWCALWAVVSNSALRVPPFTRVASPRTAGTIGSPGPCTAATRMAPHGGTCLLSCWTCPQRASCWTCSASSCTLSTRLTTG